MSNMVTVWNTSDWSVSQTVDTGGENRALVFYPNGRYLLAAQTTGKANLQATSDWKLKTAAPFNLDPKGEEVWDVDDSPMAVSFGPESHRIAVSNYDGDAVVCELQGDWFMAERSRI
jgi:hypothetical protein